MAVRPFVSVDEAVRALMEERQNCAKDTLRRSNGHDLTTWPQSDGFQVHFNRLPAPVEIEQIRHKLTDEFEREDAEGQLQPPRQAYRVPHPYWCNSGSSRQGSSTLNAVVYARILTLLLVEATPADAFELSGVFASLATKYLPETGGICV